MKIRFLLLAACGLTAFLPAACQSPSSRPSAAVAGTGTLSDALSRAHATATSSSGAERSAVQQAAILWLAQTGGSRKPVAVPVGGRTFTLSVSWPESLLFDELLVPPPGKDDGTIPGLLREGAGAPLLARWKYSPERKARQPLIPEGGFIVAVTATLGFHGSRASLRLHDPRMEQTVVLGGHRQTLAADFGSVDRWILTTMKADKTLGMSPIKALRRSSEYLEKTGLFSLEPPSRDRIPVVFIHGLASRPLTWQRVFNELSTDQAIMRRYQFYYFRYPSGVPVIYSAAKCREGLALLKRELGRVGNTVYRDNIVLIGHSMGGLVSKSQVQSSGDRVWVSALGAEPQDLKLPKAEMDALRPMMEFTPNPDIRRVIFVCTPHRGAKMADGFLGSLGRRLIKLPFAVMGGALSLVAAATPASPVVQRMKAGRSPSSLENLAPSSLYVQEAMKLPISPAVHLHSIIGNRKGLPLTDPKCSDGAVPYSSAHLDSVDSELVVRSNHSAQERPETIAEIRRILLLHLRSAR